MLGRSSIVIKCAKAHWLPKAPPCLIQVLLYPRGDVASLVLDLVEIARLPDRDVLLSD